MVLLCTHNLVFVYGRHQDSRNRKARFFDDSDRHGSFKSFHFFIYKFISSTPLRHTSRIHQRHHILLLGLRSARRLDGANPHRKVVPPQNYRHRRWLRSCVTSDRAIHPTRISSGKIARRSFLRQLKYLGDHPVNYATLFGSTD